MSFPSVRIKTPSCSALSSAVDAAKVLPCVWSEPSKLRFGKLAAAFQSTSLRNNCQTPVDWAPWGCEEAAPTVFLIRNRLWAYTLRGLSCSAEDRACVGC